LSKFIFIPHDLAGGTGALIDASNGNIISEYGGAIPPFQATDMGATNTSQLMALFSPFVQGSPREFPHIWQWDQVITFTQIATFDKQLDQLSPIRGVGTNFWICDGKATPDGKRFWKFNNAGVTQLNKGPNTFLLNGVGTFCISNDESRAFYSNRFPNGAIKVWDLVNDVALTDLVAAVGANITVSELWSIPGSTDIIAVLSFYDGVSNNTRIIRRYTNAGGLVYNITFATLGFIAPFNGDDTLESGLDTDLSSCWARYPDGPSFDSFISSAFTRLSFADGSIISQISVPRNGNGAPATTCPVLIFETVTPPPPPNPGSGIYKIVPGKRNDSIWNDDFTGSFDTKIPNPFGKTGLLGE
jgi:hypothetical protein